MYKYDSQPEAEITVITLMIESLISSTYRSVFNKEKFKSLCHWENKMKKQKQKQTKKQKTKNKKPRDPHSGVRLTLSRATFPSTKRVWS